MCPLQRVDRTQLGGELALFMFKLADGVEEIRGPAHCKDHQTLTETEWDERKKFVCYNSIGGFALTLEGKLT